MSHITKIQTKKDITSLDTLERACRLLGTVELVRDAKEHRYWAGQLEHGATPRAVQEIVGHSTLNLTMGVYARVTDRSKQQAIGALPFAQVSPPDPEQNERAVRTGCAKSGTHAQAPVRQQFVPLSFGF